MSAQGIWGLKEDDNSRLESSHVKSVEFFGSNHVMIIELTSYINLKLSKGITGKTIRAQCKSYEIMSRGVEGPVPGDQAPDNLDSVWRPPLASRSLDSKSTRMSTRRSNGNGWLEVDGKSSRRRNLWESSRLGSHLTRTLQTYEEYSKITDYDTV